MTLNQREPGATQFTRHSGTRTPGPQWGSPEAPPGPSALPSEWKGPGLHTELCPGHGSPHPRPWDLTPLWRAQAACPVLSDVSNPAAETETNLEPDTHVRKGERRAHT